MPLIIHRPGLGRAFSPSSFKLPRGASKRAEQRLALKEKRQIIRRAPYTKLNDQRIGRPPPPRNQIVSFPLEAVNRPCPARRENEAKREAVYLPEDEQIASCSQPIVNSRQVVAFPPRALNQPFVQLRDAFAQPRQVERVVKIGATDGTTTAGSSISPVHQNQEPQQRSVKVSSRHAFL